MGCVIAVEQHVRGLAGPLVAALPLDCGCSVERLVEIPVEELVHLGRQRELLLLVLLVAGLQQAEVFQGLRGRECVYLAEAVHVPDWIG